MIGFQSIAVRSVAAGFLLVNAANAQISGGVFRGEVRDASKAVVQKTRIVIRSVDNGMQVVAESNSDGLYITHPLIPGSYILSATKPGFKAQRFGPVALQVNQTVRVDFALDVGAVTESIQVEATGTQLLSTETAEVSQVIASKQVSEIPLNGRSWHSCIALSAGSIPGRRADRVVSQSGKCDGQRTKANCIWWMEFRRPRPPRDAATTSTSRLKMFASSPSRLERTPPSSATWLEGD